MKTKDRIKVLVNQINSECFFPNYFDHDKMATLITEAVEELLSEDAAIMDHNPDENVTEEQKKQRGRPFGSKGKQ